MRIAFVSNVVYPFVTGGAEKRIYEIGSRLVNQGHDVTVYGRHYWDGPTVTNHDGITLRAVAPEVSLYTDNGGRRSITEAIGFSARTVAPLRRNIDEHDIVVASVFPYFPVLSTELATIGTDIPVVTTWHEVWRDYWDSYLGHLAPFGKFVEKVTANVSQHPIAVSDVTADRLGAIGPARETIEIIPNGIDIGQIRNAPLPKQSFDVLFAGRLIEHKNVEILLEAFDNIADIHDTTLGIIGNGPELERLKAKRESITHADRVEFLGFLKDYEDVLGHMRSADVFASPSTREGFGITFAEAMAADCTVIAAGHPDSAAAEVIDNAGFLVEPTVESLSKTLDAALCGERPQTNPVERAQRYDWGTVADQAETAYQGAIDGCW
ncbi:glycosyltransferase family 4 protein [Halorarius litoreus]|uniref:glycosyltransferase family 4 protein n=1 Tax=Halorarius litoreus TaxID=2962676 RepID=UPI0020CBCB5C|nr:glycosyltransferase family 4 protein [Halorarius litoreus]